MTNQTTNSLQNGTNLSDKLEDWHSENIDIDSEIEKYLRNNDLDFVAEQVTRYFGNNTFSLEPR